MQTDARHRPPNSSGGNTDKTQGLTAELQDFLF